MLTLWAALAWPLTGAAQSSAPVAPVAAASSASAGPRAPLRVLFIGNSYTYYHAMPARVAAMAAAGPGAAVEVREITAGGATLEQMGYLMQVQRTIAEARWDVVILQEQSQRPLVQPDRMRAAVQGLHARIREAGASTLLYQTWPRRSRPADMAGIDRAYRQAAAGLDAMAVAPVGQVWMRVRQRAPELDLYDPDGSHPSAAGSTLAACVLWLSLQPEATRCGPPPADERLAVAHRIIETEALAVLRPPASRP